MNKFLTPFQIRRDYPPKGYPENEANLHAPRHHPPFRPQFTAPPTKFPQTEKSLEAGKLPSIGITTNPLHDDDPEREAKRREWIELREEGKRLQRILNIASCGVPLDYCAKVIAPVGMLLAGVQLEMGITMFIQRENLDELFNFTLAAYQIALGLFFGSSCLFGMTLMWGKLRRSATAALFFIITWTLVSLILLLTAFLWLYFFIIRQALIARVCKDKESVCSTAGDRSYFVVWSVIFLIMSYAATIMLLWGRDYRRRLLELQAWEEWRYWDLKAEEASEEVGLVFGKAPMGLLGMKLGSEGGRSRRTLGPRRASLEASRKGLWDEESSPHCDMNSEYSPTNSFPSLKNAKKAVSFVDENSTPGGNRPKTKNIIIGGSVVTMSPTSTSITKSSNLQKPLHPEPPDVYSHQSTKMENSAPTSTTTTGLGISMDLS